MVEFHGALGIHGVLRSIAISRASAGRWGMRVPGIRLACRATTSSLRSVALGTVKCSSLGDSKEVRAVLDGRAKGRLRTLDAALRPLPLAASLLKHATGCRCWPVGKIATARDLLHRRPHGSGNSDRIGVVPGAAFDPISWW